MRFALIPQALGGMQKMKCVSLLCILVLLPLTIYAEPRYSDYSENEKQVIFFDDFNKKDNDWSLGTYGNGCRTSTIKNGYYEIESLCKNQYPTFWTNLVNIDERKDFEIESRIKFLYGEDNNSNSIFWGDGKIEGAKFSYRYRFGISGNGQYIIDKYSGAWEYKKHWTKTNIVKLNDYNKITVRKINNKYYYFLNNQFVHENDFEPFYGQRIGFQTNQNTKIRIDYLRVSYLLKEHKNKQLKTIFAESETKKDLKIETNKKSDEKRLALVIGNSRYIHGGSLKNPVNDANAMKNVLESLGFKVIIYEDCNQKTMKKAIDEFGRKLLNYNVGLFFYAGHGIQVKGNNYLIPVDAKLENVNDVEYDTVRADRVLAKMESAASKTNIVILDACRDNPFERSWRRSAKGSGLAFMNAPSGSIIAYATAPGNTASDGTEKNGLYTAAILQHIKTPGITIEEMFKRVRSMIIDSSGNQQVPWESTSLRGNFYFNKR
jgi:hypothetical protein